MMPAALGRASPRNARIDLPSPFDPAALGHVAVTAVIRAGAGYVFPLVEARRFQKSVESHVEGVPIVDGLKSRPEGQAEIVNVWLSDHNLPRSQPSEFIADN